eukprot:1202349-Prymnesium_polylepis.1
MPESESTCAVAGMINTDMWIGRVVDGVAEVVDAFAFDVQAPTRDWRNDLYDVTGGERDGITSVAFKRWINPLDTADYNITLGGMACVFALSASGSDAFDYYHGPSRGFATITLMTPLQPCGSIDVVANVSTSRQTGGHIVEMTWVDGEQRQCADDVLPSASQPACDHVPSWSPAGVIVLVLTIVSFAFKILLLSSMLVYRALPLVNYTPEANFTHLLGAVTLDAAATCLIEHNTELLCALRFVLTVLGLSCVTGPLLLTSYRTQRLPARVQTAHSEKNGAWQA